MYLTESEVEDALAPTGFSKDDYFEVHPEEKFSALLTQLEKDSRAIINDQLMGEGLEYKEGVTETKEAPMKTKIQLSYPVQNIQKVEINQGTGFRTFDSDNYREDKYGIHLRGRMGEIGNRGFYGRHIRGQINPIKRQAGKLEWADICQQIRITYDRGFQEIPQNVKEIQKKIIRKILTHLRQDQNLAQIEADQVTNIANERKILTEDIIYRLTKVTQARHKYTML